MGPVFSAVLHCLRPDWSTLLTVKCSDCGVDFEEHEVELFCHYEFCSAESPVL